MHLKPDIKFSYKITYPSFHAVQFSWRESVSLANDRNNVHFIMKLFHKLNIKRLESEKENTNSIEKRQITFSALQNIAKNALGDNILSTN